MKRENKISKLSSLSNFDNNLQFSPIKLPKDCKNIPKDWLIYEILGLATYRIKEGNFKGALRDYMNNSEEFQLLDSNGKRLKVKDFIEEYEQDLQLIRYFFKPELSSFHSKTFGDIIFLHKPVYESCKKLSNHPKFDNKDMSLNDGLDFSNSSIPEKLASTSNLNYLDSNLRIKIEKHLKSGKTLKCHHDFKTREHTSLEQYDAHCHTNHPKEPMYPEVSLIEMMGLIPQGNPWEQ